MKEKPSMDAWLAEAKAQEDAGKIGMYLCHNGVVRESAKAQVREGDAEAKPVRGMKFFYDAAKVDEVVQEGLNLPGIFYVRAWLNEGELRVGDDLMMVLIGGDIRPRVIDALNHVVGRLKNECGHEEELY